MTFVPSVGHVLFSIQKSRIFFKSHHFKITTFLKSRLLPKSHDFFKITRLSKLRYSEIALISELKIILFLKNHAIFFIIKKD